MQFSDYALLMSQGVDLGLDKSLTVVDYNGACAVDEFIALQLSSTSPKYERDAVIGISLNEAAALVFLVTCKGCPFEYGAASRELASAYLTDISASNAIGPRDHVFAHDYVVVNVLSYNDYSANYRAGSALWGCFTHIEDQPERKTAFVSSISNIAAFRNVSFKNSSQKDSVWRAINHTSPLERFLKLYHLLELNFDLALVEQIRKLSDDLKGIGKILNAYSGDKEFDRLLKLVRSYCPDIDFFSKELAFLFSKQQYNDQLFDILFEYSKESNPFKDQSEDFKAAVLAGFSEAEFRRLGLPWKYDHLSKFFAYVIYRVRSCIAHFRIGEYLLSSNDEELIAEAVEPILRAVLLRAYSL